MISEKILKISQEARNASRVLAKATSSMKNNALKRMAERIIRNTDRIISANKTDLEEAKNKGLKPSLIDRLTLTPERLQIAAAGIMEIISLPDPVGAITKMWRRPNGLVVGRMRIPIGVILIIYEARPNVTLDAAGLCVKSGNAVILRGGTEALNSNRAIAGELKKACAESDIPADAVQIVPIREREAVLELLKLEEYIDLVIPRGGESLIRSVVENSRIPVIKHYKGVCHIFVDANADLDMAVNICNNAKVQRPGVCNAMETLLVHRAIAKKFLPAMEKEYRKAGVKLRGCPETVAILPGINKATEDDWYAEYLDLILAVKVVKDMDEAIQHIEKYGSMHTESIITRDYKNAMRFVNEVNSSTVLINASTRFSDGFQLGLGAEIGISTSKIHAFGPMGLEELTTQKFIIYGDGQIRES